MFQLHDKVFYPGLGVAVIKEINEKNISDRLITFYKLSFLNKEMSIFMPASNAENAKVRYLCDKETIKKLFQNLKPQKSDPANERAINENDVFRRSIEYHNRLSNGDFNDMLSLYKELFSISTQRQLSFREKGLFQSVEELIVQETSVVLDKSPKVVLKSLREPFENFLIEN